MQVASDQTSSYPLGQGVHARGVYINADPTLGQTFGWIAAAIKTDKDSVIRDFRFKVRCKVISNDASTCLSFATNWCRVVKNSTR